MHRIGEVLQTLVLIGGNKLSEKPAPEQACEDTLGQVDRGGQANLLLSELSDVTGGDR
jgi:hypothetical protein